MKELSNAHAYITSCARVVKTLRDVATGIKAIDQPLSLQVQLPFLTFVHLPASLSGFFVDGKLILTVYTYQSQIQQVLQARRLKNEGE